MVELVGSIQEGRDHKLKVGIVPVDLSAAYDLCNHDILLQKMRLLRLGSDADKWTTSFLKDRYQFVEINGIRSKTLKMGQN